VVWQALSAGRLFKFDCCRIAAVVKWAPTNTVNLWESLTQYLQIDWTERIASPLLEDQVSGPVAESILASGVYIWRVNVLVMRENYCQIPSNLRSSPQPIPKLLTTSSLTCTNFCEIASQTCTKFEWNLIYFTNYCTVYCPYQTSSVFHVSWVNLWRRIMLIFIY